MSERRIVKGTSPQEDKIIAIFDKTKNQNDKIRIYYGDKDKVYLITDEKFKEMRAKPRTGKYILVRYDNDYKTLKEHYETLYKEAVYLKELTKGTINLFRTGSTKKTALQLFYDLCPIKEMPDEILQKESQILQYSTCGAIVWGSKYDDKAYQYDVVSEYPSVMCTTNNIPWGEAIFIKITNEEFKKMPHFKIGFYHVEIKNIDNRLFRKNKNNWYDHISLTYAKTILKYECNIIEDNDDNILNYGKFQKMHYLFKPFVDYLYQFKEQGVKEVKKYLNALWGALGEKEILTVKSDEIYEDKNVFTMMPNIKGKSKNINAGSHLSNVYKKEKYYLLPYARIAPFILALGRRKISNIILKNLDTCLRCHTDGIILSEPIKDVVLGNKLGDLKFEKSGKCKISNSNTYNFYEIDT
jgi:hypothetical protein